MPGLDGVVRPWENLTAHSQPDRGHLEPPGRLDLPEDRTRSIFAQGSDRTGIRRSNIRTIGGSPGPTLTTRSRGGSSSRGRWKPTNQPLPSLIAPTAGIITSLHVHLRDLPDVQRHFPPRIQAASANRMAAASDRWPGLRWTACLPPGLFSLAASIETESPGGLPAAGRPFEPVAGCSFGAQAIGPPAIVMQSAAQVTVKTVLFFHLLFFWSTVSPPVPGRSIRRTDALLYARNPDLLHFKPRPWGIQCLTGD